MLKPPLREVFFVVVWLLLVSQQNSLKAFEGFQGTVNGARMVCFVDCDAPASGGTLAFDPHPGG